MSHFTVLVPAKDEEDLGRKLLPYHEYETTSIEDYVEFVPADMKYLDEMFKEYGEGESFDEFAQDWGGYERNDDGVLGRVTNPNAKWDWWSIGGRWNGLLTLKKERELAHGASMGVDGVMDSHHSKDDYSASVALVGDVDWLAMRAEGQTSRRLRHREFNEAYEIALRRFENVGGITPDVAGRYEEWCNANPNVKDVFRSANEFAAAREAFDKLKYFMWGLDDFTDLRGDIDEYCRARALTYAFIDEEGRWHQKGEMGWWGVDDKSQATDDYHDAFWQMIDRLQEDTLVYVVDCHI